MVQFVAIYHLGMVPVSCVLKGFGKGLTFVICLHAFANKHEKANLKRLDFGGQRCRPVQNDLPRREHNSGEF